MLEILYMLLLLLMQQQADTTQMLANIEKARSEATTAMISNIN